MACSFIKLTTPNFLKNSLLNNSYLPKRRCEVMIPKAGPPSTTLLILAFVFPFSLFAGTFFASIRIADKLDEQFLEDLAINRAIMEENQEEEEGEREADEDGNIFREEEIVAAAAAADTPKGIDLIAGGRSKKTKRTTPKSNDDYLKLLVKLYKFLVRRTGSKFNAVILRRLIMSRTNRPPISMRRLITFMKRKDDSIGVIVGTVTDDSLLAP